MELPENRELKLFIDAAEIKSFTAAAKKNAMTTSALSQRIKALEEQMGTALLIRTTHTVELTEAGRVLLPFARNSVRAARECREMVDSVNGKLCGELRIGVGSFIGIYIRKAATIMMERYPDVRLNVIFSKARNLNVLLCNHELDMAFTMNEAYDTENIESEPCVPFYLRAIMGDTHPLAQKGKLTREDILNCKVILPDAGKRERGTILKLLKYDISQFNVRAVVNQSHEILSVLNETRCITFMPELFVNSVPNLVAREVEGLEKPIVSNVHFLKDEAKKRSALAFLEILKKECVPLLNIRI